MGSGVSAAVAAATNASSVEEISAAVKGLSGADRAKMEAALGDPTVDKKAEQPSADAVCEATSEADEIEVKAVALNGEPLAVVKVPASCTLRALKQKIAEAAPDAVVKKQRVIYSDKILTDDVSVKGLRKDGMDTIEVQVVLKDPVELKHDDLRVLLTEMADGEGEFESFGFEVFSFAAIRQYGTYKLREATDEDRASWGDNSWTHSMTLQFSNELKRKKFPLTQEDLPVNMQKGTFEIYGEEE